MPGIGRPPTKRLAADEARRLAGSGSEDLMGLQFGSGAVEPVGEPGQVTGRHFREEVMLQVEEHLEGDPVLHPPTQGACDLVRAVAVEVHGPHGEEGGHALADHHGPTWYQSAKPPESAKMKNTQRAPAAISA